MRFRVRNDLLTSIRLQVTDGAATPEEEQALLVAFADGFRRKWRARTVCMRPWVTPECGRRVSRSR